MRFKLEHKYGQGWFVMVPVRPRRLGIKETWLKANMVGLRNKSKARAYARGRGYTEEVRQ